MTLALGGFAITSDSASAAPAVQPAPDGVYLESPWVLPGDTVWVDFVGTTVCGDGGDGDGLESAAFVGAAGTTELAIEGFGEEYWQANGIALRDPVTDAPLSLGTHGAVSGHLVLTCTPEGGGAPVTVSMPLTISATQPATIYHSPTAWTWYTIGDIATGATVTINALGFQPGEPTTVSMIDRTKFEDSGSDLTGAVATPTTVAADGEGAVTAQVTIPAGWAPDDVLDAVIAGSSSHYLLVSGDGKPTDDPSLNLTDTESAFPGGAVSVAAGGFDPGETVVVALHSAARAVPLGNLIADGNGAIAGSAYLPAGVSPGNYRVWAGAKTSGYLLLNAPLTITSSPASSRMAGDDRYQTAVATAQSFSPFATGTGTVYLTSGLAFPDALGAGALAAEIGAPVLLTSPNSLPGAVQTELSRLHPAHVKIVGGTGAVAPEVFADVDGLSFPHDTTRIGGLDRYETNRLLISDALGHASTVYIAVGSNFPDALAAGPAAASVDGAVVLVNGSASSLDRPTLDLLTSLGVTQVRLVGGTGVIGTGIEDQLKGLYPSNVVRYAGLDRYDTASQIVAGAWTSTVPTVILASGADFPDALAAGALGLPMLTSQPSCVPAVVLARLGALRPALVTLVGGPGALSDGVAQFAHC